MADRTNVLSQRGRPNYHHGSLRSAMIEAAEAVIDECGLAGFSMREAARRAGVSPGAPTHHFKDARGLLTAVAAAAFRRFGAALEAEAHHPDLKDRLRAQALAYLRFAVAERNKFLLMWRVDLIDRGSPEYSDAIQRATGVLMSARRDQAPLVSDEDPFRDVNVRIARLNDVALSPAVAVWTLVHGFSTLIINGVFGDAEDNVVKSHEDRLLELLDQLAL